MSVEKLKAEVFDILVNIDGHKQAALELEKRKQSKLKEIQALLKAEEDEKIKTN